MNILTPNPKDEIVSDIETLRADISVLKRDMTTALEHLKSNAVSGARSTAEHLTDTATGISKRLSAQGERAVKSVNDHIGHQPLTSMLMAFSAGFLFSRLRPW